jgi:hypothetical protein
MEGHDLDDLLGLSEEVSDLDVAMKRWPITGVNKLRTAVRTVAKDLKEALKSCRKRGHAVQRLRRGPDKACK